jgi:SMC interacting uncharacterized protein involved in chromosome segregation
MYSGQNISERDNSEQRDQKLTQKIEFFLRDEQLAQKNISFVNLSRKINRFIREIQRFDITLEKLRQQREKIQDALNNYTLNNHSLQSQAYEALLSERIKIDNEIDTIELSKDKLEKVLSNFDFETLKGKQASDDNVKLASILPKQY